MTHEPTTNSIISTSAPVVSLSLSGNPIRMLVEDAPTAVGRRELTDTDAAM